MSSIKLGLAVLTTFYAVIFLTNNASAKIQLKECCKTSNPQLNWTIVVDTLSYDVTNIEITKKTLVAQRYVLNKKTKKEGPDNLVFRLKKQYSELAYHKYTDGFRPFIGFTMGNKIPRVSDLDSDEIEITPVEDDFRNVFGTPGVINSGEMDVMLTCHSATGSNQPTLCKAAIMGLKYRIPYSMEVINNDRCTCHTKGMYVIENHPEVKFYTDVLKN